MKKITVVGCGTMGSSLIHALMNGGIEVTIVDINKNAADKFIKRGARYYASLDEAGDTECILINLPNHKIASAVMNSADKERLRGKMLINTTTSSPDEVKDMDRIAKEKGMLHLDAKIENYPGDIGTEKAYLLYSGSKEVFDSAKNALDAIGTAVYLGEDVIGASVIDISVLEVHFGAIAALAEAVAYCIKNNYPVASFIEQAEHILPIMLAGNYRSFADECSNYTGKFEDASECTLRIEVSSMKTILNSMHSVGVKTPCGDAILKLFEKGAEHGNSAKNVVAVVNELI
ncbi:NAD(P)-binding domain-containing protein [Lactonifactor longoviformis]|uniref:NAD(P)-binding domain-containing protein n=1 Tax=Lactonifactor longoviformis TaxID=341220 RepID=UPI001D00215A|nr:NAD(P)-binding domain-containing protein [Lactonifactor longoviformis]MCB5713846.1 NAD(P)-binding domain-containing protein [Lactonifactor longoviformis]MCB5717868.1 NAD(P)-binding domain-containing protein [Lactonifactor longoviformis]